MRRATLILLSMLIIALPALAQTDCKNGLPCGVVPWRVPVLPKLASPTPIPTQQPATMISGSFSASVNTPTPTPTSFFSQQAFGDRVSTLEAVMNATPAGIVNPDGSYNPNGVADTVDQMGVIGAEGGIFFSYVRALFTANIGVFTPLLTFIVIRLSVMLLLKMSVWLIPVAVAVFGFIRKVVQLILDFIPL